MDLKEATGVWRNEGFVMLPGLIPTDELESAVGELDLFPSEQQ